MAVTAESSAPYPPKGQILEIIHRYRERGNPRPFNADALSRIGVPESLNARVLQALRTLDLIDESGEPTQTFESIRLASSESYQSVLQSWLKAAYADIFSIVDPSTDDEGAIRDAFRTYTPTGQQGRMVSFFVGLCEAAGIRQPTKESKPKIKRVALLNQSKGKQQQVKQRRSQATARHESNPELPSAISGLLNSLPSESGSWTQQQRNKFLATFAAVLDFCYSVVEENNDDEDGSTSHD